MPGDKTGKNLFVCIPPDHMRDDLPSAVSLTRLAGIDRVDAALCNPNERMVYISVIDDTGNTVTLPCFGVRVDEGRVVLMAHRTGRPEVPPTPESESLPELEPLPEVAKLPEGAKVIVTWRYADGSEDESGNNIWLGNIVESFGPSDTCFKPRVDGTLREKAPPGYAQPVRWRLAKEPRP